MELTAYLGTVTAMVVLATSSMWAMVSVLGRRIDDQGAAVGARIDAMGAALGARITRLESQNDAILGAVADLGHRVAHLEARES